MSKKKSQRNWKRLVREAKHSGQFPPSNNPVAKNLNEFNKPKTHKDRKQEAKLQEDNDDYKNWW